jgi:hypothetical protein
MSLVLSTSPVRSRTPPAVEVTQHRKTTVDERCNTKPSIYVRAHPQSTELWSFQTSLTGPRNTITAKDARQWFDVGENMLWAGRLGGGEQ